MTRRQLIIGLVLIAATIALGLNRGSAALIWPPAVALAVIILTRRALVGLLAGSLAGAVILAGGNPVPAVIHLLPDHLWPSFTSSWKVGALAFTLILGGFASVLERGGGFITLITRAAGQGGDPARRLESAAAGLGIICFFDGLANSMVVGRVSRGLADRAGVARVKLAYITDSTSSAVACVAFISTWIAFQLSMIEQAFALAGQQVNPYSVFLKSLPLNFYCWFTLVLLWVTIRRNFNPGPMAGFVARARPQTESPEAGFSPAAGSIVSALLPLAALLTAFFVGFIILGSEGSVWPVTRDSLVAAFGSDAGPLVMILAASAASLVAVVLFPGNGLDKWTTSGRAFASGVRAMIGPVFILLAAWMLGSVMSGLGTAEVISRLAGASGSVALLPTVIFLTGALISFATGTSWGTMGLLFPLAVPAAAAMGADDQILNLVVAAVFSGAVFGDHCSPFSDTTIVTSISCGVTPHDHVRTQIPYALITALVAVVFGFLPAGFGFPGPVGLVLGSLVLVLLPEMLPEFQRRLGRKPATD